ncbi:MAG: RHS repeat-associated core domain-containing protein, partial [Parachlamydiaceae bacterium]
LVNETISLNGITIQNTTQEWTSSSRSLKIGDHQRDFHYQSGRLEALISNEINLSYNYASSGSLVKKTTPFSSVDVQYDDSALPQTIDVKLQGNTYRESLQWTPDGKLASYDSTYPENRSIVYNYTARGFLKSAQTDTYAFDFDKPGRGILTAAPSFEISDNGLDKFGRITKELSKSTERAITYDDMGQVIIQGNQRLSWDPWGRLIAVTSDTYEWVASYDPFGRRLETKHTPIIKGKLWNSKGKTTLTTSYYDPEEEFQEIGISFGKTTFWKMHVGMTCEAIIDSTGEFAVLHHDIKNNLTAVITSQTSHWNKEYPTPYGPRGPPASETPDLISYALSLTWQSKRADPTGLIWLGARYYDPNAGSFLSPDPVSHPACLNLYAYANGDPINNTDPDGRFATSAYDTIASISIKDVATFPLKMNCFYQFKELISPSDPSQLYDLSDRGRPELPNHLYITALNGMGNTYKQALENTMHISDLCGGYNVHAVYGATRGFRNDLITCGLGMMQIDTGPPGLLQERWKGILDKDPNAYILHFPHSRGCIETDIGLSRLTEELRKRITVVAIAPGGFIDEEACAQLTHYRAQGHRDPIPYLCFWKAKRAKNTIVTLQSDSDAPWHDHKLMSQTFNNIIKDEYKKFRKAHGGQNE